MALRTRATPLLRSWRARMVCGAAVILLSSGTAAAQAPTPPNLPPVLPPPTSQAQPAPTVARPAAAPTRTATPVARPAAAATPTRPAVAAPRPTSGPVSSPAVAPAARPAATAARPTIAPPPAAARPTTVTPRPAAAPPRPAPTAPVGRPPVDVGPPPSLPDLGPPPSLPPTDAPVGAPEPAPGATPTPPPQRPGTAPPALRPTPRPTPVPPAAARPTPAPVVTPPPAATPIPTPPPPVDGGVPVAPPPSDNPTSSPAPMSPVRPQLTGDPALEAPSIGGDPVEAEPVKKGPTVEDLEALEKLRREDERKNPKKWRHGGLVFDLAIGTAFCTRQFCRKESGHDAAPGFTIGGFIGGNVLGILEVGVEAGWSTLRPRGVAGRNAVTLYGLDPALLQQIIADQVGVQNLEVDFSTLTVTSATSRAFNVGPTVRIHFIRKGRGIAYVGTGIHYQLWRNRYETAGGDTRLDFHGISAPFRVGGGAYVHPNIAVVGEFTYALAYYVVAGVKHPSLSSIAPLAVLEDSAMEAGSSLLKGLPHFGKFTVNLRFRF